MILALRSRLASTERSAGICQALSFPLYNHLLLTEDQRERLEVVLVSPRNPLNIGAAARAMANFGFGRLTVVAPYAPHWREARSAVGAPELLARARETATLAEAVAQCTLVAGTGTLTYRKPEQRVVRLPELAPLMARELTRGGRIALVFGPEKHGLTREDLSYCHVMVEIPTDPRQPSMNLGQAVAVCLYELAVRAFRDEVGRFEGGGSAEEERMPGGSGEKRASEAEQAGEKGQTYGENPRECAAGPKGRVQSTALPARLKSCPDTKPEFSAGSKAHADSVGLMQGLKPAAPSESSLCAAPGAPSGTVDLLAGLVEETMRAAGYSPRSMQAANRHDLRLLLRRLALTQPDARRILGLFRRVLWRLKRKPESDDKSS